MKNLKRSKVKVSVVIPVYNAQNYLGEMLDSVRAQSLKDIEIICINDASEDGSEEIIKSYQALDDRIIYLEQEKENAGSARNMGLLHARGKYVVFWDADDRFDRRTLKLLYRKMEITGADICVCGVCEFSDTGGVYEADGYLKKSLLPKKECFDKSDMKENIFNFAANTAWNKMFRRSFLMREGLKFQEIPQANDTAFVMLSMYLAKRITTVKKYLAFYRVNNSSSLTGKASQTLLCAYESYLFTLQQLLQFKDFDEYKASFNRKALRGMFKSLDNQTSFGAYRRLYDFLKKEGIRELGLDACREEDMDERWLYRDLQRLMSLPPEEFLLCKANERRYERDKLKFTVRRVRRKMAVYFKLKAFVYNSDR